MKIALQPFFLFLFMTQSIFSQTDTVEMINFKFQPESLTVIPGTEVVWINRDADIHTTESGDNCSGDGMWNSGDMSQGETFSFTFNNSGTFPYFCLYHCVSTSMVGTVTISSSTGLTAQGTEEPLIANVYPNPSENDINLALNLTESSTVHVEILDLTGAIIVKEINNIYYDPGKHLLPLTLDVPAGMYLCRIFVNDQVQVKLISRL